MAHHVVRHMSQNDCDNRWTGAAHMGHLLERTVQTPHTPNGPNGGVAVAFSRSKLAPQIVIVQVGPVTS